MKINVKYTVYYMHSYEILINGDLLTFYFLTYLLRDRRYTVPNKK